MVALRVLVPVLALLGGCAFAPADAGPPEPGLSYRADRYTDFVQDYCNAWPYSAECIEERRHVQRMNMEAQTQRTIDLAADRRAAATREAAGLAIRGDGRHTGQGWWCYSGTYRGQQAFGRCFRSIDTCADRLVKRVDDGMKASAAQCIEQQSASCFSTADVRSGDVNNYCFPAARTCEHYETQTRERETAKYAKACTIYE